MMSQVRFRHPIAAFCLIVLAASLPCRAQTTEASSLRLDPLLGYEFGRPLALERTPGSVTWCNLCSGDGTSYNHLIRFGASLHIPEFPVGALETNARLSLSFASGEFTSEPFDDPLIDPTSNGIFPAKRQFNVSSVVAAVGFDALFLGEVGAGFRLGVGPWGEYRILSRFVHTEQIVNPLDASFFENNARTRIVAEGDLLGSFPLTGGLLVSISKSIVLSEELTLAPELYTRINGQAVAQGLEFRSFSGGIGIGFQLTEPKRKETFAAPSPPEIPSPHPPPVPSRPVLSAHVDLYCTDGTGVRKDEGRLIPRTTLIRRHTHPELETLVHDFHAPQIGVSPEIVADAGVRWWGLSIRQGETEIARVTSEMPGRSLDLEVHVEKGSQPAPLTAELVVEDSTGAVTGARDRLTFVFDSTKTSSENVGTDRYDVKEDWWVISEEDRDFSNLSEANKKLVDELAASASTTDEVILSPASSFKGSSESIEALAGLIRRHRLSPLLSHKAVSSEGIGIIPDGGASILIIVRSSSRERSHE